MVKLFPEPFTGHHLFEKRRHPETFLFYQGSVFRQIRDVAMPLCRQGAGAYGDMHACNSAPAPAG
ncbi:hypothetical protein F1645_09755 [Novacetimonas hansenii]